MAVKVIPLDANVQIQKQILAELEILHRCNSQFIIQYFGSFFNENRIMMCTEHMDGASPPAPPFPPTRARRQHTRARTRAGVHRGSSPLVHLSGPHVRAQSWAKG